MPPAQRRAVRAEMQRAASPCLESDVSSTFHGITVAISAFYRPVQSLNYTLNGIRDVSGSTRSTTTGPLNRNSCRDRGDGRPSLPRDATARNACMISIVYILKNPTI
jgi:hypothetical protein